MENRYFDRPTQVVFADPDNAGEWIVGIAYKDEIICACCGGIFDIDDVWEMAEEDGVRQAIYPYKDWIDIAGDITGGELPEGLTYVIDGIKEVDPDDEAAQAGIEETEEMEAMFHEMADFAAGNSDIPTAVFANTWVDGIAMPGYDPSREV